MEVQQLCFIRDHNMAAATDFSPKISLIFPHTLPPAITVNESDTCALTLIVLITFLTREPPPQIELQYILS